jgi:tetratricopeptide (TPR) repeat protein
MELQGRVAKASRPYFFLMNKQELLKQADYNYQRGNRELAKKYLSDLIAAYPNEEAAWLLLAKVVEEKERKIECYKRALKINPGNTETRIALVRIDSGTPTLPLNGRLTITPSQSPKPYKSSLRVILAIVVAVFIFGTTTLVVAQNNPESKVAKFLIKATPTVYGSTIGSNIAPDTRAEINIKYPQYAPLVDSLIQLAVDNSDSGMEGAPDRPGDPILTSDVIALEAKTTFAKSIPQPGSLSSATITEQQITSWLALEMRNNPDLPLSEIQVYLRGGQIQIWGMVNGSTDSTSALLTGTVGIDSNAQPVFTLESMQIGQQTVPNILLSQAEAWLNEMLAEKINSQIPGLRLMNVNVTNGLITVSGMR